MLERQDVTTTRPEADPKPRASGLKSARAPADSVLFRRLLPALLIGMAVLTAVLIVVAAGVLLGFVPFR